MRTPGCVPVLYLYSKTGDYFANFECNKDKYKTLKAFTIQKSSLHRVFYCVLLVWPVPVDTHFCNLVCSYSIQYLYPLFALISQP